MSFRREANYTWDTRRVTHSDLRDALNAAKLEPGEFDEALNQVHGRAANAPDADLEDDTENPGTPSA